MKKSATNTHEQPTSAATSFAPVSDPVKPRGGERAVGVVMGVIGVMGDTVAIGDLACITSCVGGGGELRCMLVCVCV